MFRNKKTEGELKLFRFILAKFGYKPKNLSYFKKAITHRSYTKDNKADYSNERLEYLGDAILDSITAEYLFLNNGKTGLGGRLSVNRYSGAYKLSWRVSGVDRIAMPGYCEKALPEKLF